MKIVDVVALLFAATAAVGVNGKQCSSASKCVRTCTLKGDPHLIDFNGVKSFLQGEGWVDAYVQANGERVQVKITKNGQNDYVTGLKIGNDEFNTSSDCAKPMEIEGSNGVKVAWHCSKPGSGQKDKVDNMQEKHFDIVVEKKYWENQEQGLESGPCVGEDHQIDCSCAAPTPSPTRQPTEASCTDQLQSKCGSTPGNCFVGSLDENCEDFIRCADDNGFSECYKPKQYSCIETLKRVCHREPPNCYEGSADEDCNKWIECASSENFKECYSPRTRGPTSTPTAKPTREPTLAPSTGAPTTGAPTTAKPTKEPTLAPSTGAPTTGAPTTVKPTKEPTLAPTTKTPTTTAPTTAEPTKSPTPQPTLSCKELLPQKCGKTPKNCFVGSINEECVDFLACVDKNDFHECYKPEQYTCEQALKRVCGREPKEICYEGSEDERCKEYAECADSHGYSECYKPVPQPFKQLTCSSQCYMKGDPHVKTFFGDMYKTNDSAGKTFSMVSVDGFSVDVTVDPADLGKEYITKAVWGDQVMTASKDECARAPEREIKFENERGSVTGKVWCALPKSSLKGGSEWHLNVEIRQTFSVEAGAIQSGNFESFVQAMGGSADTECMGTGDDATQDVTSWSGEKLAKKFHCH